MSSATAVSDQYQYTRLLEPNAFRVIVLEPSPHLTASLDVAIITSTLSQYDDDIIDHYIALSYVWGDQNDTRTIHVDGQQLTITASLESALRHLRDASRTMKVWADGICINQIDNEEKNIQIRQMGKIYGLARSTIIFLGEATPECHLVLDALTSSALDLGPQVSKFLANILHPSLQKSKSRLVESTCPKPMTKEFLALAEEHILQRPWFTRVWVLQELVFSLDPWIQLGTRRIRWNIFSHLQAETGAANHPGEGFRHLFAMDEARTSFASLRAQPD